MCALSLDTRVGDIVAQQPALSRVFEREGIDYCCGGKKTLEEACHKMGIDPHDLLDKLEKARASWATLPGAVDVTAMSLTELADHITNTHHVYLKDELPRVARLTQRVAEVHGDADPRLHAIRQTFMAMADELTTHMMKEERILFPMIRELDRSETAPSFYGGSLANPIWQMESEHEQAGSALKRLRELSDAYTPPEWACNTYRAMIEALICIEEDLHRHIHKENSILFPRAIQMEAEKAA